MKSTVNKTQRDEKTTPDRQNNQLIDTAAEVKDVCARILARGRVAVDTEFIWERTYYPNLGIVQLALDENEGWLLDMPALQGQLDPLAEILADAAVEKIFHDAKQDLTILRLATGAYPKNIFDTRLAAGFIGPSATLSLLDSCALFAGLTLEKGETRSNWLQRPLTDRQYQYALDDVLFLPLIRDKIMTRAEVLNRGNWLREELKIYDNPEIYDDPPLDTVYTKVKGAARLSRKELAVLVKLAAWRETEARRQNRPRRHIIPDDPLLELSQKQPTDFNLLKESCGLSPRAGQRYGKALLKVIAAGVQTTAGNYPESRKRSRNAENAEQIRKVMELITARARTDELDPTLIATRKEVEKILVSPNPLAADIPLLRGWRFKLVGEEILQMLKASK